jgi:hypothetical protein
MACRTISECAILEANRSMLEALSDELLGFVRSLPEPATGSVDNRKSTRFPCAAEMLGTPIQAELRQRGEPFIALGRDVSMFGVSVFHTRPVARTFWCGSIEEINGSSEFWSKS